MLPCGAKPLPSACLPPSRRRDCHSADALPASFLTHLLKAEGGAAERQSRQRLTPPPSKTCWPFAPVPAQSNSAFGEIPNVEIRSACMAVPSS